MPKLLVWDLPTRLFHWGFALAFTAAYLLAEEEAWLGWHSYFGYLVAGLVGFRLVWGFVGGRYSRFAEFPPSPAAAWRYLRGLLGGDGERHVGHNPAGALAIYALLGLGLATAVSGMALLGADQGLGPLAGVFPESREHLLKEVHEFFANAMLAVVLLHIGGVILGSLRHRENLPRAMVTGYKQAEGRPVRPAVWMAALMLAAVAGFTAVHDFSAGCGDNGAVCGEAGEGGEGGEGGDDD